MTAQPLPAIVERQNDPDMLMLLRAAGASHRRAIRMASCHVTVSTLLAAGVLLGVFVPVVQQPLTLAGFVWAVVYAVNAGSWTRHEVRRAALLQETFDVELLGLPWNEGLAGTRPSVHDVSKLARQYRGTDERLRDYYEIERLPRPFDVFSCQIQNLAWGARIRRRYAIAVQLGLVVWCTAGAVVGVVTQVPLTDLLLQWFVPSLGLLLLGIDTYRSQLDTVTVRERVQQSVSERIKEYASRGAQESETPGLLVLARQVQDVLLQTRLTQARVPNWFFNRFHATDRADFAVSMGELSRIAAPFTPRLQE